MHPLHLTTITPLQSSSVQNLAPATPVEQICIPLFAFIIENSMRLSPVQIKTGCGHYLDQFLQIDSEKSYQEKLTRFTTLLKEFLFSNLPYSEAHQYGVLCSLFYCIKDCQIARKALFQATQDVVAQFRNGPSNHGNVLFSLIDLFWKENWKTLIQVLDTHLPESCLKFIFNQIRVIAEIESLRQSGMHSNFIERQLQNLPAWQQLNLLPAEQQRLYNLFHEDQIKLATVGTETLSRKYSHLMTYVLIKKYQTLVPTSLPFLWKLSEEPPQQQPFGQITQHSNAKENQLLDLRCPTPDKFISELIKPFELFVSFFRDNQKVPSTVEFSKFMVIFENIIPRDNGYAHTQKRDYDTFLAFWCKVFERAQSENPVRNYKDFFSKCSLVLRPLLSVARMHIALAFLGALLRLDPCPVFVFLEQTYPMNAHLAFWKNNWEDLQKICIQYKAHNRDLLSSMLFARYSDPSAVLIFKPFPLPTEILGLLEKAFSNKSKHTSKELFFEIKKHFGPLASYLALKKHYCEFDFHPLFLCTYLKHFHEISLTNHWSDLRKNLIDKLLNAARLGRPLKASETIYKKDKDELFAIPAFEAPAPASTGPKLKTSVEENAMQSFDAIFEKARQNIDRTYRSAIDSISQTLRDQSLFCPLTDLASEIIAHAEEWMGKELEQQKAFIRSKLPSLAETELDQFIAFLVIPEHVGCYSSQPDLLKLKQVYPKLFEECQIKQPKNPFIQLL